MHRLPPRSVSVTTSPARLAVDELGVDVLERVTDGAKRVVGQLLVRASRPCRAQMFTGASCPPPPDCQFSECGSASKNGAMTASKSRAVGAVHLVGAAHLAARRLQDAAARVLEVLAGTQVRLLPDDAGAAHLFDLARAVGDDPVAGAELRRLRCPRSRSGPCTRRRSGARAAHDCRRRSALRTVTRMPSVTAEDVSSPAWGDSWPHECTSRVRGTAWVRPGPGTRQRATMGTWSDRPWNGAVRSPKGWVSSKSSHASPGPRTRGRGACAGA